MATSSPSSSVTFFLYNLLGPTIKHLQLEWYLVLCLELITVSSLVGLYKKEFMTRYEDYLFLLLHTAWLSKYAWLRWICLWDNSTYIRLHGWWTHFVTTHCVGGQVFDRPLPKTLAKQAGISNKDEAAFLTHGPPNSLQYAWHAVKVQLWLPLLRFWLSVQTRTSSGGGTMAQSNSPYKTPQQSFDTSLSGDRQQTDPSPNSNNDDLLQGGDGRVSSIWSLFWTQPPDQHQQHLQQQQQATTPQNQQQARRRGSGHDMWRTVHQTFWHYASWLWSHGPTLQFLLPNVLSYLVLYPLAVKIRSVHGGGSSDALQQQSPSALYNSGFSAHMKAEEAQLKRHGSFAPSAHDLLSLFDLFALLWGISLFVLCVSFFSRIVPPIPDQIAGNNVAKDIRRDAKSNKTWRESVGGSGGGSGAGKGSSHHHHHHGRGRGSTSAASSSSSSDPAQVWTERHSPISTENRVRVHRMVLFWRLLDLYICCGWLPRSDFLARALGHASSEKVLPHRLSQDLYPVGISRPHRPDVAFRFWEKQVRDPTSFIWHVWNLALLPILLLAVQMLYLNRTYISISSYFCSEWTLIGPVEQQGGGSGDSFYGTNTSSLGTWDPRKKYKIDDLVIHNGFLYQAAHSQPEGRPVEPDICDWQEPTLHELGHPGTSSLMAKAFAIQFTSTVLQAIWWFVSFFYQDRTPEGLLIAVASNLIASYALSSVGMVDCDELSRVNDAILGRVPS